ncbi:MAG: sugar ABC transporter ATP-binding protein [Devosia sp.]
MTAHATPLVEMFAISRQFPGVKALDGVNFTLEVGEVHVLFGENGAGKSTLISILAGVYRPSSGVMRINGIDTEFTSVKDSRNAGIGAVFQEFSLVPTMTVAENIYLGDEPLSGPLINRRAMRRNAQRLFDDLGFEIDVTRLVASLSRAEQQMVEIAKAFQANARILILDEPTASLTERETERLFEIIANARARGVGIIYISHRIHEFAAMADRITVLRDGKLIGTVGARELSETALVEMMTGRSIDQIYPQIARAENPEVVLSIRGLRTWGVSGVDLDIRKGEVLGVAGLVGSGKSRTFRAVIGLNEISGGSVTLDGRDVTGATPPQLIGQGIFYLPSDRKTEGLLLAARARENIAISMLNRRDITGLFGLRSAGKVRALTDEVGRRVDLSKAFLERTVSKLSGGNQQKVLFGKGFGAEYDLYILDEPTVGVDMGTRAALYRLIKQIAEAGKAVVVISSDLPEVMNLAHRLVVFSHGRISAQLEGTQINEQTVLNAFFQFERQSA